MGVQSRQYHIIMEDLVPKVERWRRGEGKPKEEIEAIFGNWIRGRIERKAENKDYKKVSDEVYELVLDEITMTLHKLRTPEAFVTWAIRVIDHRVAAYFRKLRREQKAHKEYLNEYKVRHSTTNQGDWVAEEWLDKISPKHAQVVRLHILQDIPVKEIAAKLGIPEGTVKSRLYYARKALKKVVPKK